MPGPLFSGGVLINDTSGELTRTDNGVWTESTQNGPSSSGWGGFFGQLAAAGANVGLAFAQKDLQGNGYRYNQTPFVFGPGYPQTNSNAPSFFGASGLTGLLLLIVIVFVIVKVVK